MKSALVLLTISLLSISIGCQSTRSGRTIDEFPVVKEPTYHLRAPDEIAVSVYPQSELGKTVIIRPDGKISLPLIGDVFVEGMTPMELSEKLTAELSKYAKNPSVTVIVTGFNSQKIYVIGEVYRQGAYPYTGTTSAFEAVQNAGSFTRRASLGRVILVRGDLDNPQVIDINMKAVVKKGIKRKDLLLQPEDIVFVPPNGFAKAGYVMEQVLFPFTPIFGLGRDVGSLQSLDEAF